MDQRDLLKRTIDNFGEVSGRETVMIGFDGFVDEIVRVVGNRIDAETFTEVETIGDFSGMIAGSSGLSMNMELVSKQVKLGGNGPIMANALKTAGYDVIYIGALGLESIHPVFLDFIGGLKAVYSISDPGHTDALEFRDGKIMLGKLGNLKGVNWANLVEMIDPEELSVLISSCNLLAITNWTMLPEMNSIIRGFTALLAEQASRMPVFVDLADPGKRTERDIRKVLELLQELQKAADVILGLNRRESDLIAEIAAVGQKDTALRAEELRKELGYAAVVIHPVNGAAASSAQGTYWVEGPYTDNPLLSTGAGDNFNAGFCNGYLKGMLLDSCLMTGVCASGYYVRKGCSPSKEELINFMRSLKA